MWSAIPVEECIAIGVYFLASRSCYCTIALVFQKRTSTVASVVVEVCLAIGHTLLKEGDDIIDEENGVPPLSWICGWNVACDGDGIFFSMLAGHSSVNHDTHVFRSSMLFKKMEEGTLIPGDGAYPLCKWLMKPYAVPRNESERHYNKIFNRSRNVVEHAFGRLKARFRRLSIRMEAHIQNVNSIIASAVILHNICEKKKHIIPNVEQYVDQPTETNYLDNQERNYEILEMISSELLKIGYRRSADECWTKTKSLRKLYKQAVLHNNTSGSGRSKFIWFKKMAQIFQTDTSIHPLRTTESESATDTVAEAMEGDGDEIFTLELFKSNDYLPSASSDVSATDAVETTNYEATLNPATRLAMLRKCKQRATAAARLDNTLSGFVAWVQKNAASKEEKSNARDEEEKRFHNEVISNLK
ncbi:hypothetical protein JRQ81_011291 [Phrynocephalus forsythii]|uniref:DDE Tnp4 domain-containing protein n=1 Tax=Phrynocephalus forsythii TaxID=171643 RepID=A0A9Q0Y1Q6_9SAUR|nr:hypothetical protein JRQ81_011291 [Phrynocephalus forsythii]